MGIFGWSYPPGCSGPPDQEDQPCLMCGEFPDECVCEPCTECGEQGNPVCYEKHGMKTTMAQVQGQALLEWNEREQAAACRAEGEYWADPKRAEEEAELAALMQLDQRKDGF